MLFYGEDVTMIPASQRKAGFAFQHYALFRHLTVFENIAFGGCIVSANDPDHRCRRCGFAWADPREEQHDDDVL